MFTFEKFYKMLTNQFSEYAPIMLGISPSSRHSSEEVALGVFEHYLKSEARDIHLHPDVLEEVSVSLNINPYSLYKIIQ